MGPWLAGVDFIQRAPSYTHVEVHLYGSLAKTGVGHGTDVASVLGLAGFDFTVMDPEAIFPYIQQVKQEKQIVSARYKTVCAFDWSNDIVFHKQESLAFHPNGMILKAFQDANLVFQQDYYSLGGGFISIGAQGLSHQERVPSPYPCHQASDILRYTTQLNCTIPELVYKNEQSWATPAEIEKKLDNLFFEIKSCIFRGIHRQGILPGGLKVKRRAADLHQKLMDQPYEDVESWIQALQQSSLQFDRINKWISCFALAVNEENAAFSRIITAPTNGASGVIPAVLLYAHCFIPGTTRAQLHAFLLTAGEIGTLFKKNATISAAMGGCQAEVGVSASMAAGGLAALLGGSTGQILMAAEIAMEHHLGLTCDPVGGLVQIPCIERNSMGAMKAITAAYMALESNPKDARVSLDDVIRSMWETSLDMHQKYKETSEGGLATNISVALAEC